MSAEQKKILVLYYSQTGQLTEIVNSFTSAFNGKNISVETIRVIPEKEFPFPWKVEAFFDAMPESVLAIPAPLEKFVLKEQHYDLVIFAYQPWFLSLSIPANSVLRCNSVEKILKNTPVVSLIGSRNMWLSSQEKLKKILKEAGTKLVGNIALADRNSNLVSAITILSWMMNGTKESYLGIFPKAGISDDDILNTKLFGETVCEFFEKENFNGLQQKLIEQGAAEVKPNLMFIEERAPRLFSIWANFIVKRKNRKAWLVVFKYYLLFALFIVAPIVLTVYSVLFKPFLQKNIQRKIMYYSEVK